MAQLQKLQFGVGILRMIGSLLVGFLVSQFTSIHAFSGVLIAMVLAIHVFLFSRLLEPFYGRGEKRFLSNLSEKEQEELKANAKLSELAPWDASLSEFVVSQDSPLVLQTIKDSGIKERFGVSVTMIERGSKRLLPPKGDDVFLPFDNVYLVGTDEQLTVVRPEIELREETDSGYLDGDFGLGSLLLRAKHRFVDRTIRESGLRENINGLTVGIERNGERFLNPDPDMELLADDLIWLVGEKRLVNALRQRKEPKV